MLWIGETDYQETMQEVKTPLDITGLLCSVSTQYNGWNIR